MMDCYSPVVSEQTASYLVEIKDKANERLAIFTFVDVTADEVQTVLAEFGRILGEMSSTVVVNRVTSAVGDASKTIARL